MVTTGAIGTAAALHGPILQGLGWQGQPLPEAPRTLFPAPSSSAAPSPRGPLSAPSPASPAAPVDTQRLANRINAVPRKFEGVSSAMVLDTASGKVLYQQGQTTLMIPASNMKTLTALGALSAMPAHTRFQTSVTSPAPGQIVLRGGGDPYLRSVPDPNEPSLPSLQVLAQRTAASLKKRGTTTVSLGFDHSLFSGPDWAPTWPTDYADQVTRVQALMVDGGRGLAPDGKVTDPVRTQTPAQRAAEVFAEQLKKQGITVSGAPSQKPAGASGPIAVVESAPLDQLVTSAMVHSDNTATEMLLRQVALADRRPGSLAEGVKALQAQLEGHGVWRRGAVLQDGSGLSRDTRITAEMLAKAWTVVAATPRLRGLLTATPVAGVSGTLADRFVVDEAMAGRGRVHAKTGTLREVSSLSGWTVTESGQSVIIVLLVNKSKNDWWARAWIDTVAATVSGCGC